ncbi:ASCH domain-containing protein [Actinacidiphila yeochonensis]|uniref:ASCH domain-containing protein n=1 Tax=Actinacidiphila yeochonensis TaxID=89050 RepID=UPI00099B9D65|nr:ASCH domain-containing protein [Actinacidiphila yeochonensis]
MNDTERALLISVHPRFATAILEGSKTVELRRQRVAVPEGTPLVLYATSPVMALVGTARVSRVDSATPAAIWRQHRAHSGINRDEYDAYMQGASQASALVLDSPQNLDHSVPLTHLRAGGTFHPPQSYRYITRTFLLEVLRGHKAEDQLLAQLDTPQTTESLSVRTLTPRPKSKSSMRSASLLTAPAQ